MSAPHGWQCPHCSNPLDGLEAGSLRCRACSYELCSKGGVWLASDVAAPPRFDDAAVERLQALDESGHFWPPQRRRLFAKLIDRIGASGAAAVELGCGTGGMLPELDERFATVVGLDGHAELLERARERSRTATLVQADACRSPLEAAAADLVVAFDVIEHVDPDALLAEARRLVRPGGRLLISAPAFPSLWSRMDERAGHRCRYRWRQLDAELRRNGWLADGHTHFLGLLFPLVYASRRAGGAAGIERRPPRFLNQALAAIVRLEVLAFSRLTLPVGSSIVAWATSNP